MKLSRSLLLTLTLGTCSLIQPSYAQPQIPHHDLEHVHFCDRMQALLNDVKTAQAIQGAKSWLKTHPKDPDAYLVLGQAAAINGDFPGALAWANATYKVNPLYRNVHLGWVGETKYILQQHRGLHLAPVKFVTTRTDSQNRQLFSQSAALLKAKNYNQIEATFKRLSQAKTPTASGSWQATTFAVGLFNVASGRESDWQTNHRRLLAWQKARPQSLLARIAVARSWTEGASIARGDGWVNSVTPQMQQSMKSRLGHAKALFHGLKANLTQTPLIFSGLQAYWLLAGPPGKTYDQLLARANAAFPNYAPFWIDRAIFLMPRWYGQNGSWEKEITRQANKLGGKNGDMLYARVCLELYGYSGSSFFYQTQASWPRIKKGYVALIHTGADPVGNATDAFHMAISNGDFAFARQMLLGPLKGSLCGGDANQNHFFARERIYALTGGQHF